MKNLIRITLFFVFVIFTSQIFAQSKKNNQSVLWKVSGNGLSKPSYLFGTVHMICAADFILWPNAKKAFEQTDQLTLELNMSDPQEMQAAQKLAMGEKPLSQILTADQKSKLETVL